MRNTGNGSCGTNEMSNLLVSVRSTFLVSDDWVHRCVDHRGVVHFREVSVHEIKLEQSEQHRPDRFDLHVSERLPNAPVSPSTERNVTELLAVRCVALIQEPATLKTKTCGSPKQCRVCEDLIRHHKLCNKKGETCVCVFATRTQFHVERSIWSCVVPGTERTCLG